MSFNSYSRDRVTQVNYMEWKRKLSFNSLSREGSDGSLAKARFFIGGSNSRSREGSDYLRPTANTSQKRVSTRAPAKGATIVQNRPNINDIVSTHAPTKGSTMLFKVSLKKLCCFNSRSREGSDWHQVIILRLH